MVYDDPLQLPPEFHEQPLTARMLDDFATCPRKFLLSFFVTREAERHFRGGTAALHQALRQALVDLYNAGGPARSAAGDLLAAFETHWEGGLCADALEEEQLHAQGLRMLQDYHADHAAEAVEVLGTDQRLLGEIGGQTFVAVADLVLAVQQQHRYVRLTSSRRPPGPAELTANISAQLLWVLVQGQSPGAQVLYYSLRQRKAQEVVLDDQQAEQARQEISSRVARVHREADFAPRKGQYCRWCRSRARCPAWRH